MLIFFMPFQIYPRRIYNYSILQVKFHHSRLKFVVWKKYEQRVSQRWWPPATRHPSRSMSLSCSAAASYGTAFGLVRFFCNVVTWWGFGGLVQVRHAHMRATVGRPRTEEAQCRARRTTSVKPDFLAADRNPAFTKAVDNFSALDYSASRCQPWRSQQEERKRT